MTAAVNDVKAIAERLKELAGEQAPIVCTYPMCECIAEGTPCRKKQSIDSVGI